MTKAVIKIGARIEEIPIPENGVCKLKITLSADKRSQKIHYVINEDPEGMEFEMFFGVVKL